MQREITSSMCKIKINFAHIKYMHSCCNISKYYRVNGGEDLVAVLVVVKVICYREYRFVFNIVIGSR